MNSAYIITDLEGTAGVTSFTDQAGSDARYLDRSRRLATAELNAAVEGLVACGVDDILVMDGHGPEGLWYEDLHPAVRILHGRPLAPWNTWAPIVDQYEAGLIVGQHAMAGVRTSNMSHTQNFGLEYIKINGRAVGEIGQSALYWGAGGMPFIFLSGEQDACAEAEDLISGIETVAVKQGLGRHCAISLSAVEARRRIREGVERAVRKHRAHPISPTAWDGPYELEKRYFDTHDADRAASAPGVERVDSQTVRRRGDDIRSIVYA